jgi:signal transduction histidine kinase
MLHLVGDILDISAIEAGKLHLDLQEAALMPLVQERVTLHGRLAQQKRIGLAVENGGPPPVARVDPEKLGQVLDNLLTNAIKFSPPQTTVTVRLYQDDAKAVIAVRDQGPGIPARECENLFQPFSRTSVGSTGGEQSTGLGLAIVRKIVEAHCGRVWVHSEIGKGSTFYVSLPTVAGASSQG